jgi:transposase
LQFWRDQYARGGTAALRRAGRPSAGELSVADIDEPVVASAPDAARQIAALERKIGQQQFELDFFSRSIEALRAPRRSSGGPGGTASTR